ncbi:MAG TPA: filamentous hemagglutinin family protein [Planctomycetaceae bacterium]|nr:filamentous hemagglutinin family protein [Planctomycetaceae bacterium]|tara:strand:- start:589 stop:1851 length:1263 start_codon:yes stop_codon:yes gene_type:complete
MSDFIRKMTTFSLLLFTGFCFLKAGAGLVSGDSDLSLTEVEAAVPARIAEPQLQTTPIQQMRPGMRVLGRNPDRWDTQSVVEPDSVSWRLVSVRMEQQQPGQFVLGQLLRPLSWIRQNDALPGAVIQLEIPEIHVAGDAEVLSISACPPIDPGDGPVVLSTFKNIANNVLNIYVDGETEPIGVTAGHPIWSEDRQAFVHTDQLQPGERLRSAVGKTVRITSIEIRAGPEPVYNLEIAGEHVYSVTDSGLLVHNITWCQKVAARGATPSDYGLQTIAENTLYLTTYNETLRKLSKGNNGYSRLLSALEQGAKPSIQQLNDAWKAVGSDFSKALREAGQEIHVTHHWNWPKTSTYSDYILDPRNLVPIPSTRPKGLHPDIHYDLTSHPDPDAHWINKFIGEIRPRDALDLGPARSIWTPPGN